MAWLPKITSNPGAYPGQEGALLGAKTTVSLAASGSAGQTAVLPAGLGLAQLVAGVEIQQLDSDGSTWQTLNNGQGGVFISDGTNTRFQNTSGAAVSGYYWMTN